MGGTGLYLRAVVDDLRIPGRYPDVAAALERELDDGVIDVVGLHGRLALLDPVGAERMEPTNRRRIVRALEVTIGSGQPFSSFGPGLEAYPPSTVPMIGIVAAPDEVDRQIEKRFAEWMDAGLLDEVRALAERPQGIGADGPAGARLPGAPGARRGWAGPGRLRGRSGAPDQDPGPPPGQLVPPGPADRLGRTGG